MAEANITIFVAFLAGIVSFLSPCVLPIIPGYLAYLAGASLKEAASKKWQIFINSVFFVLGFSLIFALLGVLLNSLLQTFAFEAQVWLARIGGGIIIFFGLYLTGLIKLKFLETPHKIQVKKKFNSNYLTSFLFGAAFAAGWTPCVGAVLGGILGLAATQPNIAFFLLLAYSIGLGLPFLLVGLFTSQTAHLIHKYARALNYIKIAFGLILIGIGILAFTQNLNLIANFDILNQILLN